MASPSAQSAEIEIIRQGYLIIYTGFVIGTTLFGVTLLQGIFYFRTFTKDPWYLKLVTAILIIFDSLTTILPAHSIYYYLIENFGNYAVAAVAPLTYRIENLGPTFITLIVQSFYAHQIWIIGRSKTLTIILVSLTVIVFGLGLEISVDIIQNGSTAHLASSRILITGGLVQGLAALCDILITGSLCWYLHSKRSGAKRTDKLIDRIIVIAVNRGLITTTVQICFLVLNVSVPGRIYWFPFHQSVGKFYTNSYLAMLNMRARTTPGPTEAALESTMKFEDGKLFDSRRSAMNGSSTTRFESSRDIGDETTDAFELGKMRPVLQYSQGPEPVLKV